MLFFLLLCTVYVLILHANFLPQSPCAKSVKNGFGNRSVKVQLQDSRVDAETSMNSDMFFSFFGGPYSSCTSCLQYQSVTTCHLKCCPRKEEFTAQTFLSGLGFNSGTHSPGVTRQARNV